MRARYYDPATGRFISEDPIGFEGGLNLYAYVGGNPINYNDPSGLFCLPCAGVGAAIGGVSAGVTSALQGGSLGDIAASTFIGVVGGGVSGLTLGAGGTLLIGATSSDVGSAVGQFITSGTVDPSDVALSAVAGTTGGAFGLLARKAGQSALAQTVTSGLATAETQAIFNFGSALNNAFPARGSRPSSGKRF